VTTMTARRKRDIAQSKVQFKMLEKAGIDPREVGRVFNRTTNPTGQATVDIDNLAIPNTPAELESMLGDSKTMTALVSNGAKFGEFITNYARATYDRDLSIRNQVETQVQQVLADFLRDNADGEVNRLNMATPDMVRGYGDARRNSVHNPKAMGAALDREFESSSDYFRTIWHNANRTADMQAKLTRVRNAFSSTVPSEGGFLIPETLRAELLRVSLETSIVRPRARVIPMETLRVPFPAVDSTSNVSSVYGGIVGYWTEEGAALTESSAKFSRIVLDAKKLTAYTEIPNELISDSQGSFQAFLDQVFPEALGFYEDDAFLTGDGVGKPLGALNADAMVTVAAKAGQPAGSVVWENIIEMYSRMLPSSLSRAVWIVSPSVFVELATMALSVGTGGSAIWLTNGHEAPAMSILGRPVIMSEKVPNLGSAGDVSFVDFGFYLIGDRQVMSALSSAHYKFGNDLTAYRIIQRVDGRPWLQSAITPKNEGPTLSPFVQLGART
jgi:HK97 family phage major capsid protein